MKYIDKKSIIEGLQDSINKDKDPLPNMGNEYGRFAPDRIAFEAYSDEEMEIIRKYKEEHEGQVEKERKKKIEEEELETKLKQRYSETHDRSSTKWHSGH